MRRGLQGDPTKRGGRWESDFIWNSNWKDALDYDEGLRKQVEEGKRTAEASANGKTPPGAGGKGMLSLTSKVDLNSMDVDLSAQLKPRKKPDSGSVATRATTGSAPKPRGPRPGGYPAVPATKGEVRSWTRSGRYSRKAIKVVSSAAEEEEIAAQRKAEAERFDQLKRELQLWAMGLTVATLAATFAFYGRDVAASYGVGALGGLFYLRLLNRSVESFGAGSFGGAVGSNRLLIPIILALGYNRYNLMLAEQTGVTLQLLPMLAGFFTYKGAVIARQSLALFSDLSASMKGEGADEGAVGSDDGSIDGEEGRKDVTSVDRAFNRKMLMQ